MPVRNRPVPFQRRLRAALPVLAAAPVLAGVLSAVPAQAAPADPDFELPFACGEAWAADTRSGHSPSYYSVDFNAYDDFGHPVLAATTGQVTRAADLGNTSYGRYLIVDHGSGWSTLYAHLDKMLVREGQWVDQGQTIGLLGTSGGSTGPHLHFEERLNGSDQHAYFHRKRLAYNTTVRSYSCADSPVTGDWNGDRVSQVGVWRRSANGGVFALRRPDGTATRLPWGQSVDQPVTGDWNGDRVTDVGVWQRLTHRFVLRTPSGRPRVIRLGTPLSMPVTGDWNGDGRTEVGVYNFRLGRFTLRARDGSFTRVQLGSASSVPVTGDWNGDGTTDVGVYEQASGTWRLRGAGGGIRKVAFGNSKRIPVTGDWDGDGDTQVGTWSPRRAVFAKASPSGPVRISWGHRRR